MCHLDSYDDRVFRAFVPSLERERERERRTLSHTHASPMVLVLALFFLSFLPSSLPSSLPSFLPSFLPCSQSCAPTHRLQAPQARNRGLGSSRDDRSGRKVFLSGDQGGQSGSCRLLDKFNRQHSLFPPPRARPGSSKKNYAADDGTRTRALSNWSLDPAERIHGA